MTNNYSWIFANMLGKEKLLIKGIPNEALQSVLSAEDLINCDTVIYQNVNFAIKQKVVPWGPIFLHDLIIWDRYCQKLLL